MNKSLLDLMPKEEAEKAIERGRKRMQRNKGSKVSPEMYTVAEFGYYFGWEGVLAIKRGYIDKTDSKGNVVKEPFTLDEVLVLLEAARKVWYSKVIEQSHGNMVASIGAQSKSPSDSFNTNISGLRDRADLG